MWHRNTAWDCWMLENMMTAYYPILIPARILEHANDIPAVHGGYYTYLSTNHQHSTYQKQAAIGFLVSGASFGKARTAWMTAALTPDLKGHTRLDPEQYPTSCIWRSRYFAVNQQNQRICAVSRTRTPPRFAGIQCAAGNG
jgi:hypothetical protein